MTQDFDNSDINENDIAIVGMAAHLPGAGSISEYWTNLHDGVESIRRLDEEALLEAGETPDRLHHKNYVPAAAVLDGFEMFDADFFGFSPKEAAIMDPQHRQFLEVVWEAFENAGHPPEKFDGPVGVFAGCGMGSYFYFNVCSNPDLVDHVGMFLLRHTGNDKDFLSTRASHIFDLKGPSINLQTACSTSLVATHYACQALLNGECDMALAGGVTIELPHKRGYIFEDGEILSPDGHCHAFDHRAEGTVFGSGAGVVVLRRLADAIADGDHIWGVIKGTAINNDGAAKAGYLAPSVDGQAQAIAEAHAIAGVDADTIDYIECHGTGTFLGDPIEVAALDEAFRRTTDEVGFCRIGSVKTNIGHLDTAAGVASLIKTTLSLHNNQIPPSLGFEAPNPAIDFETSPFRVNSTLTEWTSHKGPRRAGVNSLGVGGTNAHAILQEAPQVQQSEAADWPFHVLTISGRSRAALDANAKALGEHLRAHPEQPLADVAFTLKEGRRGFEKRRVLVAETHEEAADLLESGDMRRIFNHSVVGADPEVVFMFPGGGAQYAGMARDLYETEPVFQEWIDRGFEVLQPKLDYDIRAVWLPEPADLAAATERLKQPSVQLPLIMIVEYALAQLWMSWGVTPAALVGHSMGENTAACVAGVMSFEDCVGLVLLRGQLFDTVPAGGMLSVPMAAEDLKPLLGDDLDLAGLNAPELTVVSGPQAALDALAETLKKQDVDCQRIPIDIAAHSRMLDPILGRFGEYLRSIDLSPPTIPFLSNRSGDFITDEEATSPDYWVGHLRNTIRFADCITTLSQEPERVYLEVGPGKALSSLAQMSAGVEVNQVVSSLRHPDQDIADDAYFLGVIGRLWATGVEVDWDQVWGDAKRRRVPLPTYAFQRSPYFIEPGKVQTTAVSSRLIRNEDVAGWGYRPVWRQRLADCEIDVASELNEAHPETWLVFLDDAGVGKQIVDKLRGTGHRVIEVLPGDTFSRVGDDRYILAAERGPEGYDELIRALVAEGITPSRVAHFWLLTRDQSFRPGSSFFHRNQEQGFYSLLFLAQAIGNENLPKPIHITVVTNGAAQVQGETLLFPDKTTVAGPVRVIPRELPGVTCASIDITLPKIPKSRFGRRPAQADHGDLAIRLLEDLLAAPTNLAAAFRDNKRFELEFRPLSLEPAEDRENVPYRDGGTYLITGGFGGIGLTIAEDLYARCGANIVLLARSPLPPREHWERHLRMYGPNEAISQRIQAVQKLETLGAEVLVAAADVSNFEDMRRVIEQATDRFGPISGVIHAAGTIQDGPLLTKTSSVVEDVFTPKIHGTQVLHELFPDGSLDFLVLFSSTSTVTAPAGQVDYVAANEYLNAYAKSRAGDKTRVLALNWGIWNEVGMAANALAERTGEHPPAPTEPTDVPLLDLASFDAAGNRVFSATYTTTKHWFLDEHRTKAGDALVPGTGYLELAAEALRAHGETEPFEIRDIYFLRPLRVGDGVEREIRVRLKRSDEGYSFEVHSSCMVDGRLAMEKNAEGRLVLLSLAAPAPIDLASLAGRFDTAKIADPGASLRSPQEDHLNFGPRWRVLQSTAYGNGEGLAELCLPAAFGKDLKDGFLLHPGLLDLATGWAMELIEGYRPDTLWVPVSYGSVRVYRDLPARLFSWVRSKGENQMDAPFANFDVTLCDPDGNVCLEVEGFSLRKLENEGFAAPRPPGKTEVEFDEGAADQQQPLSAVEERLLHNLSQGILPAEGADAFNRALSLNLPQVVISSLDLKALALQASDTGVSEEGAGQKFQRPELDSNYVEPGTDIERTLAGFWEDLLGVQQVGTEDSFFDLGGHSLIAVRLFSMVKKAYRIEFPISVLFEAPTIAKCAALIGERVGGDSTSEQSGDGQGGVPKSTARRFTHLVPMHDGEGGTKTPFFLVAGMFGNVLNLRHLAHLIGTDRPFYGMQARGLYGDQDPHTSLVEAARDYIGEMRIVQPHGPYLLGGFSGGGITAYEIARQLEAEGESIAQLIMLDTPLPTRAPLSLKDRVAIQMQELGKNGVYYPLNWVRRRFLWELGKLTSRFEDAEPLADHQYHNEAIEVAFMQSVGSYNLQPWAGSLALFRPPLVENWKVSGGRLISSDRAYMYEDNGWTRWVPETRVFEVPGNHDSMVLEPHVRVLAAHMKACIEDAEAGQKPLAEWQNAAAAE